MPSFAQYMAQYDHEHTSGWNKLLHATGIPMIFAGLLLLPFGHWVWAAGLFAAGWVLLFAGHRIEGNRPAFFQGPVYLLVGPVWVAKEFWIYVTGAHARRADEKS